MDRKILAAALLAAAAAAAAGAERYRIEGADYELEQTREYAVRKAVKIDTERVFESADEFNAYMDDLQKKFTNQRVFDSAEVTWSAVHIDGAAAGGDEPAETAEAGEAPEGAEPSEVGEAGEGAAETAEGAVPPTEGDKTPEGAAGSSGGSDAAAAEDEGEEREPIIPVRVKVVARDSKHLLIVPYPKFSSSDGFNFKIKMKDMNFIGTMSPLTADLVFAVEPDDKDEDKTNVVLGVNFDYNYPFPAGPFDASWNNKLGIDWTIGESVPEYDATTGFTFELPFDTFSLVLDLKQSIRRNTDYREYGDTVYATSAATLSLPVTVAQIDNWADVKWTPYTEISVNYDLDGISRDNDDLSSPTLTFGHSVSTGRVDWLGNFRRGVNLSLGQSVGYNFQRGEYMPKVSAEAEAFASLGFAGVNARVGAFAAMNTRENVGSKLRGIRKDQKYADINRKALETKAAIVMSLDIPIHIVTTDWEGWIKHIFGEESWMAEHFGWMRTFDFELQLSPFGDFALTRNEATGKAFAIKDGWYACGLEVLVYPKKWRSIVVRGSFGIDAGRKIVKKVSSKLFDDSWRKNGSAYEMYIGVGLQY